MGKFIILLETEARGLQAQVPPGQFSKNLSQNKILKKTRDAVLCEGPGSSP